MANGIKFGGSEMDDLKFGAVQVDEVYLGTVLVWPLATTEFVAGSISNSGNSKASNGTYAATQHSTSGSGTGATFDITIVSRTCTSFTVTNGGSGYATSDTVTLDITALPAAFQNPRIDQYLVSLV